MRKKHEKVIVNCCVCGKEIMTYHCWAKRQKVFTCSVECRQLKGKVKVQCFICGKWFFMNKQYGQEGKRHVCSSLVCRKQFYRIRGTENGACKSARRVIVKCVRCGKEIVKTELQANKNKKHYCSIECKRKHRFCIECGKELITKQDLIAANGYHTGRKVDPEELGHCLQCWRNKFARRMDKRNVHEGYRWCPRCNKELLESDFYPKAVSWCRRCEREKAIKLDEKNPTNKLRRNISRRIHFSLKDGKNGRGWESLVGYTAKRLIRHLERQFEIGMSWENYGAGWHLEHKIPVSAFNFTKTNHLDFRECWSLKNLRPMWAKENLSKGAKIEKPFQPSFQI